jgi:hypothetical protein
VLGRSTGLSEEKLAHLLDDPLPEGVYDAAERVAITYARRSTRMEPIDDDLYAELKCHYPTAQIMELCFTVGLSNIVRRRVPYRLTSPVAAAPRLRYRARPPDRSEADDGRRVGLWNVSRV